MPYRLKNTNYPKKVIDQAHRLYCVEGWRRGDIAQELGVKPTIVTSWIRRHGWKRNKERIGEFIEKTTQDAAASAAKEIAQNRIADAFKMVDDTIKDCRTIKDHILEPFKTDDPQLSTMDIRNLVQSYRDLVSIEREAYGLNNEHAANKPLSLIQESVDASRQIEFKGAPIRVVHEVDPIDVEVNS